MGVPVLGSSANLPRKLGLAEPCCWAPPLEPPGRQSQVQDSLGTTATCTTAQCPHREKELLMGSSPLKSVPCLEQKWIASQLSQAT